MIPILIFVITMLLSVWAMSRVKKVYAYFSQIPAASGMTGAEVAATILEQAGIQNVEIVEHDEMLGDHYDPINRRLVLSSQNYRGTSVAAVGVSAHECGHAIQHKIAYAPLHWRMAAVGITNFASQTVMLIPLIGLFMGFFSISLWIMAAAFGIIMLFNLVTLPVEFDASRRAKAILIGTGITRSQQEIWGVKKTLDAAALTYVAAFVTSLGYFLWHMVPLMAGGPSSEE